MTLKVAGVGAGYFAAYHHEAWSRIEEAELVGVCDREASKARAAADRFGTQGCWVGEDACAMLAALPDLDVLDVATPPHTHLALVRAAAAARVPTVVCQKPLAPTLDEAHAVVEAAEAAGVRLVVHENFRFQPWFVELRRLLLAGAIGPLHSLSFRLRPGDGQGSPPAYVARQPYFAQMERFLVHETGIHFIDTFRFLLGEEDAVAHVYADLQQISAHIAGEDAGRVLFTFASGRRATLDANRHVDHDADDCRLTMGEMLLEGGAGVLRLDGRGRIFLRGRAPAAEAEHAYEWERRGFAGDSVFALQRHVVDHLLRGAPLANGGRAFLENVEVEELVYSSAARHRRLPRVPVLRALPVEVAPPAVAPRCELGEGVVWDERTATLLFVDINRATVHRYDPLSGRLASFDLSAHTQHVGTVVPVVPPRGPAARAEVEAAVGAAAARAVLHAATQGELVLLGTTDGLALCCLAPPADARFAYLPHPASAAAGQMLPPHARMNDGKCDAQGRFWVGSVAKAGPGNNAPPVPRGAGLWVLEGWRANPVQVLDGVTISNGLAWAEDGKRMYYIDSTSLGVDAFDFHGAEGGAPASLATGRRRAVDVCPSAPPIPDGCALDAHGHLWVALYGGGQVRRYDVTSGELLAVVRLPRAAGVETTACAFGGEGLAELYVTTASKCWPEEKRAELPLGGRLFKVTREALAALGEGIRGAPTHAFKL